jgi:hypothetical protein
LRISWLVYAEAARAAQAAVVFAEPDLRAVAQRIERSGSMIAP